MSSNQNPGCYIVFFKWCNSKITQVLVGIYWHQVTITPVIHHVDFSNLGALGVAFVTDFGLLIVPCYLNLLPQQKVICVFTQGGAPSHSKCLTWFALNLSVQLHAKNPNFWIASIMLFAALAADFLLAHCPSSSFRHLVCPLLSRDGAWFLTQLLCSVTGKHRVFPQAAD